MAKLLLALLAVVIAQSLALTFRQENLCCTEIRVQCWNHSYQAGYEQTCVELTCLGDGRIKLNVTSPHQAHKVVLQSRLSSVNGIFPIHPDGDCKQEHPTVSLPVGNDPWPGYEDPFPAANSELHDMNADYADFLASIGQGRNAAAKEGAKVSVTLAADSGKCSPDGRSAFVKDDTAGRCYSQGQMIVSVTEYLAVPSSPVDLVTVTYLFLDCGVRINETSAEYQPVVKPNQTAQCQKSEYSLDVVTNQATQEYEITIKDNVHPNQDGSVGWQLHTLKYTDDLVIENHAPTVLGDLISATIQNKNQVAGVSAWTSSPAVYEVRSDLVTNPVTNEVAFSAGINYCYNRAATRPEDNICGIPDC